MEIKTIQSLLQLSNKTIKNNFIRFLAIIITPRNFFNSIKHNTTDELLNASVFAVFISILNLLIVSPVHRILGIKSESTSYLLIDTIVTLLIWFLCGIIFHICAKIFKGKGSLQSSVVIFLYMTALFPIFKLLCLPAETITRQFILDKTIDIDFYLQLSSIGNDSPFFMLWSVLQLIGLIFYAIYLNIGFKIVHKIDDVRRFLTVFLGIIWHPSYAPKSS